MRRQRKIAQMEEQINTPGKKTLNKRETCNLSDAEFKTLVYRNAQGT